VYADDITIGTGTIGVEVCEGVEVCVLDCVLVRVLDWVEDGVPVMAAVPVLVPVVTAVTVAVEDGVRVPVEVTELDGVPVDVTEDVGVPVAVELLDGVMGSHDNK
jgi:hypothetical protein